MVKRLEKRKNKGEKIMKLRNKLILSCAALAAVATTAVSTTFAWYTSNDEVTASNISGASANSGSELLLISADKTKWGTSIADVTENPSEAIIPLAYAVGQGEGTGKINPSDGSTGNLVAQSIVDKKLVSPIAATEAASGYVGFTVYLKNASTSAKALNMNIESLTNTTKNASNNPYLPDKNIIGDGAQFLGLASSASNYTVNALRALCLDLEVWSTTDGTNFTFVSETVYDLETITDTDIFDISKVAGSTVADSLSGKSAGAVTEKTAEQIAAGYALGNKFNAHQYFNSIMSPDQVIEDTTQDPTTKSNMPASGTVTALVSAANFATAGTSATANNFLMLKGKIFLNGWDLACFDACQGQTFNLDLSFDVKTA